MRFLLALTLLCACPHPISVPKSVAHVVACAEQAIKDQGVALIPAINTCLVSGNATACLLGLVNVGAGVTEDLIACLAHGRGAEYASALASNPKDVLSARAAKAARQFEIDRELTIIP